MKSINKIGIWISIILLCLFVLVLFVIPGLGKTVKIQDWIEFEKDVKEQCPTVRDINYRGEIPGRLIITVFVRRPISLQEAETLFQSVRNYMRSNKVIEDFNRYTLQEIGSVYSILNISTYYYNKDGNQVYFFSANVRDNFESWQMESSDGYTGKYD